MKDPRKAMLVAATVSAVALLGSSQATAQQQGAESLDGTFMPEFYFYDPNQLSCTLRLELPGKSPTERKRQLLAVIDYAYSHTEAWSQDFVISGVDYINFEYAHIISDRLCPSSEGIILSFN